MRTRFASVLLTAITLVGWECGQASAAERPNIIIVLADDMGWRDTGYSGNSVVKTPHLDAMSTVGVRFDYFYPGQQMCSPGRFAILTGRTPCRTGLHHLGSMRAEEITLAKALKTGGYKTAQFGKWHLGDGPTNPVKMGFEQATWSPNYYDLGAKLRVGDTKEAVPLAGDTSVACMDLALAYIRERAAAKEPFFTYICFGSPHAPHQAAPEFKKLYANLPEKQQDFWGEISGVDAAVGNLRAELRKLQIADNTLLWFTSDNGGITKDSQDPAGKGKMNIGVRTVALAEWPAKVKQPVKTSVPCAHVDIYPTVLELTGIAMPHQPPLDGQSILPLFGGEFSARAKPLGFMLWNGSKQQKFDEADFVKDTQGVWLDAPHKLIVAPRNGQAQLFDIYADPAEKKNLADEQPDKVAAMRKSLEDWQRSVRRSYDGLDFAK